MTIAGRRRQRRARNLQAVTVQIHHRCGFGQFDIYLGATGKILPFRNNSQIESVCKRLHRIAKLSERNFRAGRRHCGIRLRRLVLTTGGKHQDTKHDNRIDGSHDNSFLVGVRE